MASGGWLSSAGAEPGVSTAAGRDVEPDAACAAAAWRAAARSALALALIILFKAFSVYAL